jgi:hypothetical protein
LSWRDRLNELAKSKYCADRRCLSCRNLPDFRLGVPEFQRGERPFRKAEIKRMPDTISASPFMSTT